MSVDCLGIITKPITHRQVYKVEQRLNYLAMKQQSINEGWFFIDTAFETGIADDLWVCDLCNTQIDVGNESEQKPVKLLSTSYQYEQDKKDMNDGATLSGTALCDTCYNRIKTQDDNAFIHKLVCGCCRDDIDTPTERQL